MRAILAIAVGCGMIAGGLRLFPDTDDMPTAISIILCLFGAVVVLAGINHGWLRIQRRRAYAGGRERRGTVRFFRPVGMDDDTSYLIFATSYGEWLLTVDSSSIRKVGDGLAEGLPARAYMGADDRIYGLDIGKVRTLPISAGIPFEGKLRERVERIEERRKELGARSTKS
ncbi:hypothetical protein [Qipengyuania vesicularis]|uniref:hypothetical protein n=1 Tax=Qipengyuania vesicularis TaxID=2867232 RepID=UPI001C867A5E|nr:hypothetical protein [Qipengyuania vesicularis]MBX7527659.1 hypothetical protein [Qipengyuania vesicularis]